MLKFIKLLLLLASDKHLWKIKSLIRSSFITYTKPSPLEKYTKKLEQIINLSTKYNISYRITEVLGYSTDELIGESLYTLCYGEDAEKLKKCHLDCKLLVESDNSLNCTSNSF